MSDLWLMVVKFCVLFVVAHLAIEGLSRLKAGDHSERANHRRGWILVGVLTVAALALAMVGP